MTGIENLHFSFHIFRTSCAWWCCSIYLVLFTLAPIIFEATSFIHESYTPAVLDLEESMVEDI